MGLTRPPGEDWIAEHRAQWDRKPGLRDYYRTQIFDRVVENLSDGPTLQLGTGPGFFAEYHPGMVNTDIAASDRVDVVTDVHDLRFDDGRFANVVGIDVLHHFTKPGLALRECARVLAPGGRLVLVEPWAGPLGRLFYRFVHHEDCAAVADPWNDAFPASKDPMEGNAILPITVFRRRARELERHVPGLSLVRTEPFGCLSMVLTGGFQNFGLPAPVIRLCYRLENVLPSPVLAVIGLRCLFVLDKQHP